jgi:hypothetical protein
LLRFAGIFSELQGLKEHLEIKLLVFGCILVCGAINAIRRRNPALFGFTPGFFLIVSPFYSRLGILDLSISGGQYLAIMGVYATFLLHSAFCMNWPHAARGWPAPNESEESRLEACVKAFDEPEGAGRQAKP